MVRTFERAPSQPKNRSPSTRAPSSRRTAVVEPLLLRSRPSNDAPSSVVVSLADSRSMRRNFSRDTHTAGSIVVSLSATPSCVQSVTRSMQRPALRQSNSGAIASSAASPFGIKMNPMPAGSFAARFSIITLSCTPETPRKAAAIAQPATPPPMMIERMMLSSSDDELSSGVSRAVQDATHAPLMRSP